MNSCEQAFYGQIGLDMHDMMIHLVLPHFDLSNSSWFEMVSIEHGENRMCDSLG